MTHHVNYMKKYDTKGTYTLIVNFKQSSVKIRRKNIIPKWELKN